MIINEEESVIMDTEIAAEWMYFAVMRDCGNKCIIDNIESIFNSVLSEPFLVKEKEIDIASENKVELSGICDEAENISNLGCQNWLSGAENENIARNELNEISLEEKLEQSHAASELLAALMGRPSIVYEHATEAYGEGFVQKFKDVREECNREKLDLLLPKTLEVINILKMEKSVRLLGFIGGNDIKAWLDYISKLNNQLVE